MPGTALGAWALGLGGTRSAVLESVAAASPLAWCLERAAHAAVPGSVPLGALAVAAVCLATTARRRS